MLATFAALALVIGGCSAVYMWWHGQRATVMPSGTAPAVRARASSPVRQPANVTHQPETSPASAVPVALANSPANPPAVEAPQATGSKVLLDLVAREVTWLSVSSDGKPVFSGLLHPNESKIVEGEKIAKIRVGNAGGLEVHLNGRLLPMLGERGQVLIVVFTPDNFQIFAPPKESD